MDREDLRHAIAAVVDEGLVGPELTVEDLVPHVAADPRSIGWALRRLGFKQVRGKTRGRRRADGTRALCGSVPRADTLAGVVRGRTRGARCGRGSCAHEDGREPATQARRGRGPDRPSMTGERA